MNIEVRTQQFGKNSWAREALGLYEKKILGFTPFIFSEIRPEKDFLRSIGPQDILVVCDERGKDLSSQQFAKQISNWRDGGKKRLIFFGGRPFWP